MFIGKKPTDTPLTSSDVADGIITNAKLAQDIISGDTALAVAPADTDEFLVSDAGTLKRIDYSLIKSTPGLNLIKEVTASNVSAVTVEVELVSDTGSRGGANTVTNGTSFLVKDVTIPAGSSLELLSGGKVVLEATDEIKIDCSVADKVSGTLSIMEIT